MEPPRCGPTTCRESHWGQVHVNRALGKGGVLGVQITSITDWF